MVDPFQQQDPKNPNLNIHACLLCLQNTIDFCGYGICSFCTLFIVGLLNLTLSQMLMWIRLKVNKSYNNFIEIFWIFY